MITIKGTDITSYVTQGGISESTQRVMQSISATQERSIGAHNTYNISARVPTDIKNAVAECMDENSVKCSVDGIDFYADVQDLSCTISVEYADIVLWDISFTLFDIQLSKETEAANETDTARS